MSKFLLRHAQYLDCFCHLRRHKNDADKAAEAWRNEGMQKFEFTRFASAGKKISLDFAYALNPDCSPVEGGC